MKKIIFSLIIILLIVRPSYANVENKIIINVGNQIISSYELKSKIRNTLFISEQEINQTNINDIKEQALRALINYKIKKQEVVKYDIEMRNNIDLDNHLNNVSKRLRISQEDLTKLFISNKLDYDLYVDEIENEILWQKLIFNLYKNKISIDENEINRELNKLIINNENITEYKLAEIEVASKNSLENKDIIKQITDEINKNGFKNTAIKFSISSSSMDEGNLGWVNSNSLAKKISVLLDNMKIDDVSVPIIQGESIIFLKVLDKKNLKIENDQLQNIKEKIINKKTMEMLSLFSNNHLSKLKNNILIESR